MKKDKNAPKGAKNAFAIFKQQTHGELKGKNPGASFGDMARLASEAWKGLSADDKARYERLAKEDKVRFTEEKRLYDAKRAAAGAAAEAEEDAEEEGEEDEEDE